MIERNNRKNKTMSSYYYVKLTVLVLLLLSPLVTHAIDNTNKLRGKDNELENLSYESIDSVIHVPAESGNMGLSTGEGDSLHLSHIKHESSMLDDAGFQREESIDTKSSNVLKDNFVEQAEMASDQSLSMTFTSGKPNGAGCLSDEECNSGRCSASLRCEDKLTCGYDIISPAPAKSPTMSPSTYENISTGLCALAKVKKEFDGIPSGNSPKEVMETFAAIANIASTVVPQFALIGQALGLIAGVLNDKKEPVPKTDPMIEYFDKELKILNTKLDNIYKLIQDIPLELCKSQWESQRVEYIVNWESSYSKLTQHEDSDEREQGREDLLQQCKSYPPYKYTNIWQDSVLESGGSSFTGCFSKSLKKSANRVLYFRREYSSKILKNVYKAARYNGICVGLRQEDKERQNEHDLAESTPINGHDPAVHIENIYKEFAKVEKKMYDTTTSDWKTTLQSEYNNEEKNEKEASYPKARTDPNVVMNALKYDFFPDYRYAAVLITKNMKTTEDPFIRFGHGGEDYGSFYLDRNEDDDPRVLVFYRKRSSRQRLSDLPKFNNCVCPGEEMCKRKENDRCRQSHCESLWHQIHENSKRNNKNMHDLYASRGTVLIKTLSQVLLCPNNSYDHTTQRYNCEKWVYRDSGLKASVSYASGNDLIIQSFDTPYEGGDDNHRYKYKLIGIRGDFGCSDSLQCSNNTYCNNDGKGPDKCSGTAPTPSVSCSGNGNPTCSNDNECKPDYFCRASALYTDTGSTNFANLISNGLAHSHLRTTGAFMNDDDCESESESVGSSSVGVTRASKTCKKKTNGSSCSKDAGCESGRCHNKKCENKQDTGKPCWKDSDCKSGTCYWHWWWGNICK